MTSGVATSPLPAEFGGNDLWQAKYGGQQCTVLRVLGAADLSLARIFEGHLNAIGLVCRYGSHQQMSALRAMYLRALGPVFGELKMPSA